jgi:GxxExxY protein
VLDLLVNGIVIVEVKSTEMNNEIYQVQTLTYLRLTMKRLGLVINFGEKHVKDGIHRVVNGL